MAPYGIDRGTCDRSRLARDRAAEKIDRTAVSTASVGRSMDAADQACIGRILEYALDRAAIRWYGASGNSYGGPAYAVTPIRTFERDGLFCRDFHTVGSINGETEQTYATACRMPDGIWRLR